jgi:hypothetical protein
VAFVVAVPLLFAGCNKHSDPSSAPSSAIDPPNNNPDHGIRGSTTTPPAEKQGPVIFGTLYNDLDMNTLKCSCYPLAIGNPDSDPISFDRVSIVYNRAQQLFDTPVAQDICFTDKGREEMNFYPDTVSTRQNVVSNASPRVMVLGGGRAIDMNYITIYGDYDGVKRPTQMTIALFLGTQQIGKAFTAQLPKMSMLGFDPQVAEHLQTPSHGYNLRFTEIDAFPALQGSNMRSNAPVMSNLPFTN